MNRKQSVLLVALLCAITATVAANDADRLALKRSILADELLREKSKLQQSQQALSSMGQRSGAPGYQEALARVAAHKANVGALESELRSIGADGGARPVAKVRVKPAATAMVPAAPERRWETFERDVEEWDVYRRADP